MSKNYKIACIGNMNNNLFTVTRFLRDSGHDAHLLLLNEEKHFLPEADTFSNDYKDYVHQLDWFVKNPSDELWTNVTPQKIREDLQPYKILIGCGYAPAFVEYGKRKLDLFIPYGSDFYELPFMKYWTAKKNSLNNLYPEYQKKGIENSRNIVFDYTTEQEPVFKKFKLKGKRQFVYPPFFYTIEFNKQNIEHFYLSSSLYPVMKKLRDENELIIFQHSRQSWKNPQDEFSNKRNDILVRAFATFITQQPSLKAKLVLLEYGVDVNETKKLCEETGVTDKVIWLPKSPRKELFVAISLCDIGVAELGMSFLMYGTVGEFMTMEIPFIHNCKTEEYTGKYPELYDNNHADSVESLTEHFNKFIQDRSVYQKRASNTHKWFMKYMINEPIKKIDEMVNECANLPWYKKIFN